jgi:hypothetical protein
MKVTVLIGVLLMLPLASALEIQSHYVEITADKEGAGSVREEYNIVFDDVETEGKAFNETSTDSVGEWAQFGIYKSILVDSGRIDIIPTLTKSSFARVTLTYSSPQLARPLNATGVAQPVELIGLTEREFRFFNGEKFALPFKPSTTITANLPKDVNVRRELMISPDSEYTKSGEGVEYRVFTWKNPFESREFRLIYEKETSISNVFSAENIVKEVEERLGNPIYFVGALILIILVFLYRKELSLLVTEAFVTETKVIEEIKEEEKAEKAKEV